MTRMIKKGPRRLRALCMRLEIEKKVTLVILYFLERGLVFRQLPRNIREGIHCIVVGGNAFVVHKQVRLIYI